MLNQHITYKNSTYNPRYGCLLHQTCPPENENHLFIIFVTTLIVKPFHPEHDLSASTILAARLLSYIPRTAEIPEQELKEAINGNDPYEQNLYKYAIQLLIEEGYVKKHPGVGIGNPSTRFSLTNAGRAICDNGGYLRAIKQKEKKEEFKDKVYQAEGKKKIFDHNVKIFIFIIAIIGGIVGILNILEK